MRVYHSATARSLNGTFRRLIVDVRHLPGVERFQDGGGALRSQRHADVPAKMLGWHLVLRTVASALEVYPERLDAIGAVLSIHVLFDGVLNGLMRSRYTLAGTMPVGADHGIGFVLTATNPCKVRLSAVSATSAATMQLSRSFMSTAAVLPTVPRLA